MVDQYVDLFYPSRRGEGVQISLVDVRAANDLRVSFDFDRDGWVLEMPRDVEESDPCWVEVGFVSAWEVE